MAAPDVQRQARLCACDFASEDWKWRDVVVPFDEDRSCVAARAEARGHQPQRCHDAPCACRCSGHETLHTIDIGVAWAARTAATKMMEAMSDTHTTLRWVAASALRKEWFTASSSGPMSQRRLTSANTEPQRAQERKYRLAMEPIGERYVPSRLRAWAHHSGLLSKPKPIDISVRRAAAPSSPDTWSCQQPGGASHVRAPVSDLCHRTRRLCLGVVAARFCACGR